MRPSFFVTTLCFVTFSEMVAPATGSPAPPVIFPVIIYSAGTGFANAVVCIEQSKRKEKKKTAVLRGIPLVNRHSKLVYRPGDDTLGIAIIIV